MKSNQRLKPLSLAPPSVDEALSALLKTPPPEGGRHARAEAEAEQEKTKGL